MASTNPSQEIPLDQATPGMVLAEAVLDKSGARLISPDVELTEKSIHALKHRGIQSIKVLLPVIEEGNSQVREQQLQRLDELFKNSLSSEANRLLLDCLRRYRMMQ
ncbi:hypothetical protein hmeg3_03625 [Herbaspirillum sp. meg3]|jgi:hypothetical protein|uniref:hypothetical protein n=1 Tax=Herbaspirillum sp. meg3 TaxID=2025949 RepID=UPI000B982DB7|nr:hypothetical protein [Herbaspirillum sp. meg3]ASU37477.1 hypothetical protein hmeg3_03625 [Herbaspirillum sp. meg3]